jgi:hypothetical protein
MSLDRPQRDRAALLLATSIGTCDDNVSLLIESPEPARRLGRSASDAPAPIELLVGPDHRHAEFDPARDNGAGARDRLAGSGTHRQECLTARQSATIHSYSRRTRQPAAASNAY